MASKSRDKPFWRLPSASLKAYRRIWLRQPLLQGLSTPRNTIHPSERAQLQLKQKMWWLKILTLNLWIWPVPWKETAWWSWLLLKTKLVSKFSGTQVRTYSARVSKMHMEPGCATAHLLKTAFSMIRLWETTKCRSQITTRFKKRSKNMPLKSSPTKECFSPKLKPFKCSRITLSKFSWSRIRSLKTVWPLLTDVAI